MIDFIYAIGWLLCQLAIVFLGFMAAAVMLVLVAKGFITLLLWLGWR